MQTCIGIAQVGWAKWRENISEVFFEAFFLF